jgi:hypothetical protein
MSSTSTAPIHPDSQVKAYELGLKETDQVIAIQNHTAVVANLLLVITGALWAALHAKDLVIAAAAGVAVLLLHIFACLAVLQLLVSNTNAVNLRFRFLGSYSHKYYPDIEAIGREAFVAIYGGTDTVLAKYFRWGRCPALWYFIPVAGALGSSYLLVQRAGALAPLSCS